MVRRLFLRALAPLAVLAPFRSAPSTALNAVDESARMKDDEVRILIESDGENVKMMLYVGGELYGRMIRADGFAKAGTLSDFTVKVGQTPKRSAEPRTTRPEYDPQAVKRLKDFGRNVAAIGRDVVSGKLA